MYLLKYTLQLADNALIQGHRLSEWCGHGPILEQDIALTNTALDHLGTARSLYQYAATQYNALSATDKEAAFTSPMLQANTAAGMEASEDAIAYLRDAWDFNNALLTEQPNGDWAQTITRCFFIDAFNYFLYDTLRNSSDAVLAAVAEKAHKETTYHLKWSSEWMIRLGDGTEESHNRAQEAVNLLWSFTGEFFIPSAADKATASITGIDLAVLHQQWQHRIETILTEATLAIPANNWMQQGGKEGTHSEHLGYLLAEMQYMQRAYPGMDW